MEMNNECGATSRRQLAQKLHDSLCQDMTGLGLVAHVIAEGLKKESHPLADEAGRLRDLLKKASGELRDLVGELNSRQRGA